MAKQTSKSLSLGPDQGLKGSLGGPLLPIIVGKVGKLVENYLINEHRGKQIPNC